MPALPIDEWIVALGTFYDQFGYLVVFAGTLFENTALLGLVLPGNSLALLDAFYSLKCSPPCSGIPRLACSDI